MQAHSEAEYPRPPELLAAQAELDAVKAIGTRDQMDSETQARLDAAINKRNSELDKRNSEWQKHDDTSMFKSQMETCNIVRKGIGEGTKSTSYFDDLRYAGFSTDETLDIILQIDSHTPGIGKSVKAAFCILGMPADTIRTKTKGSMRIMFVYPKMFVHAEDGLVTAWSDR